MWSCRDSQEVGLEAAILERVRNSSLVERDGAENGTGLKHGTEGGAKRELRVGERRCCGEGLLVREVGAAGSENAGMSSENTVRTGVAERLRVPTQGQSASGESGLSWSREAEAMDNR
jgi:hypothetical protein